MSALPLRSGAAAAAPPLALDLGGIEVPLQVRRHPRARRITLRLAGGGEGVVVVLPPGVPIEEGLGLAREHAAWIRSRLAARPPHVPFADGTVLPVGGRSLTVHHDAGQPRGVRLDEDRLLVGGDAGSVPGRIRRWLRDEARRAIGERIAAKAALLPRLPAALSLRDTRSRWGSCASSGRLSFSWRLILAPPLVLDYVVAHELAHLRHHGHGPAFWAAVAELCDQVRPARAWLRRNGNTLFRYG